MLRGFQRVGVAFQDGIPEKVIDKDKGKRQNQNDCQFKKYLVRQKWDFALGWLFIGKQFVNWRDFLFTHGIIMNADQDNRQHWQQEDV